ncbi:hypothetical protein G5B47_09405 [Paenibacillus sp. 7124]|uniref:PKD domain-containing protein n=1 Tax=Paenibacillus apii TaxID=1850370 RepID=A0A6M1PJA6_9BACL|nr:hypothetical protein [Paenibacillus apii]NGM82634.1 hypothetical protein [Paenibacillus apii]
MKKLRSFLLIAVVLLGSLAEQSFTFAASTQTATISIPVNANLMGDNNAYKNYSLDLPSGIAPSSIDTSSIKYSGSNTVSGAISLQNGTINLKLQGVASTKRLSNVTGYNSSYLRNYRSNPSNSIWRYSDGVRWQVNEYDENTDSLIYKNYPAEDNNVPSLRPPRIVVSAAPPQNSSYLKWYNGSAEDVIESKYIVASTIQAKWVPEESSSYAKEVKFKNGKIIVNYAIPFYVLPSGAIGEQDFENQDADATHPLTGWATGRKYQVTIIYYYTADALVPTYSYSGTVTFKYTPITEPTLDGKVTVVNPSPNPTQFKSADVPVTLRVNGNLLAYTDAANIEEWVFYAKETGSTDVKIMKDYNKVLSSTQSFTTFNIPKDRITNGMVNGEFDQEYTLTVTVRFSKPVPTSSGTISSLTQTMQATVGVTDKPVPPPSSGGNKRPVAILSVPDSVMAGEEFLVYGADSYDPDGTIVDYNYGIGSAVEKVTGKYGYTWYPLAEAGYKTTISLVVTDNDDLSGSTTAKVEVQAPKPRAAITVLGTKKENRKVTLHNASTDLSKHYPMDPSKTRFTIQAISGGAASDIKYSGSLNGVSDKDVVFKKPGTYKATIYVENIVGYSSTAEITFDIVPDEPPVPYISVPSQAYRDPDNGNRAAVVLDDLSFSPDYDYIGHRLWQYRYDSDNDGDFSDESWVILSDANESRVNFNPDKVGRYEIRLTVTEEFDQPTIDEFVSAADRKSANTDTQSAVEKIVTVYNRAPIVDWSW